MGSSPTPVRRVTPTPVSKDDREIDLDHLGSGNESITPTGPLARLRELVQGGNSPSYQCSDGYCRKEGASEGVAARAVETEDGPRIVDFLPPIDPYDDEY